MPAVNQDHRVHFANAIRRLKNEQRYRVFVDLERDAERFPIALWRPGGDRGAARGHHLVFERLSRHGRSPKGA